MRYLPLSLLRLSGNPIISKSRYYRKTTIARMPTLKYLDESPVFDKEKRLAHAWMAGGLEAEKQEREVILQEEAAERDAHRQAFHKMVQKAKADAADAKGEAVCEDTKLREDIIQNEHSVTTSENEKEESGNKEESILQENNVELSEDECLDIRWNEKDVNMLASVEKDVYYNKRASSTLGITEKTMPLKYMKFAGKPSDNDQSYNEDCMDANKSSSSFQQQAKNHAADISQNFESGCPSIAIPLFMNFDSFGIHESDQMRVSTVSSIDEIKDVHFPIDPMTFKQSGELPGRRDEILEHTENGSAKLSAEHSECALKERMFKKELQERILQRAAVDAQLRFCINETDIENESKETGRPVIWGTNMYKDLWSKAGNIDHLIIEDTHEGGGSENFAPTNMELDMPGEPVPVCP